MNKISADLKERQEKKDGVAVMDSGFGSTQTTDKGYEIPVPSADEFFSALKKASRKMSDKE